MSESVYVRILTSPGEPLSTNEAVLKLGANTPYRLALKELIEILNLKP